VNLRGLLWASSTGVRPQVQGVPKGDSVQGRGGDEVREGGEGGRRVIGHSRGHLSLCDQGPGQIPTPSQEAEGSKF
jgi:hypothetical protein